MFMSGKALLLDSINHRSPEILADAGYTVDQFAKSITQEELAERAAYAQILGVRSGPDVRATVIDTAEELLVIGCFCVGTNHVTLEAATRKGIAVFNAAHEN